MHVDKPLDYFFGLIPVSEVGRLGRRNSDKNFRLVRAALGLPAVRAQLAPVEFLYAPQKYAILLSFFGWPIRHWDFHHIPKRPPPITPQTTSDDDQVNGRTRR